MWYSRLIALGFENDWCSHRKVYYCGSWCNKRPHTPEHAAMRFRVNAICLACANTRLVNRPGAFTVLHHNHIVKPVHSSALDNRCHLQSPTPWKNGPCSGIPHCDLLTARVEMNASIHEQIWGSSHHSRTPKKADWKLIKNASALVNDRLLLLAVCIEGGGGTVPCPRCWRAPGGLSHCLAARLLPYQRRHINEVAVLFVQMLITTSTYLWMATITSQSKYKEGCWLHGGHLNRPLGKMLR